MDRRNFLRKGCTGCAGLVLLGTATSALTGCSTLPIVRVEPEANDLRIPLERFAEQTMLIARVDRLPFDVLAMKNTDGTFGAVYLQCTHEDQPVTATTTGLHCPSHGSRFAIDGTLREGPAARNLRRFTTISDTTHLIIHLT
ncbi:MAG: Rieske 2Fe-2S domain-containing protein [Flavobacteriales bacterium]|nr:Rieske 2Fe-2S domain-containing protein [Flavobacteriales bacterium]MBL0034970.1 Rieske 2Fe-2S domain-containing protein [Flavobacteriales bacterium]